MIVIKTNPAMSRKAGRAKNDIKQKKGLVIQSSARLKLWIWENFSRADFGCFILGCTLLCKCRQTALEEAEKTVLLKAGYTGK